MAKRISFFKIFLLHVFRQLARKTRSRILPSNFEDLLLANSFHYFLSRYIYQTTLLPLFVMQVGPWILLLSLLDVNEPVELCRKMSFYSKILHTSDIMG